MYADDTQITATAETISELQALLDRDVENLNVWLRANKLSPNTTKTEFLIIASKYRQKQLLGDPKLKITHDVIKRVTKAKLLGVIIDDKLSWDDHIHDIIIPKVLKGLRILRELRPLISTKHLVSIYYSVVLPHFDYCSAVWGNCGNVLKYKLQTLQNRAARIITRSGFEVRSSDILDKLGWCNLETRRKHQKAVLMYKIYKGFAPTYLRELFTPVVDTHDHNLRNCELNWKIPRPNTEYLKRSLSYDGAQLWNNLPSEIKNLQTVNSFTCRINKDSL